jgi:DNA-binding transcriptional ArsR family regulator
VKDGVCGILIAEKLGVSHPTASEHLRILSDVGFLKPKRIKQWIFYRRNASGLKVARRALADQPPLREQCGSVKKAARNLYRCAFNGTART